MPLKKLARRSVFALLVGAALASLGCVSPTLPLPPPEGVEMAALASDGTVTIKGATGSVQSWAVVYAYNEQSGEGVIDTADEVGSFEMKLSASVGDSVSIWQEAGRERSAPVILTVKAAPKK